MNEQNKMDYREIGVGGKSSLLGYGCMRFPKAQDGSIDEEKAEALLDHAIANGVTYIDTAYPYHDGQSEPFVGKVLNKYPRSSYLLATKLPIWKLKTLQDAKDTFAEQLSRLDKDYVDFYLFHALNKERWELIKKLELIPYFEGLQREGKIKNLGFSFHDEYEVFEEIVTYRKWDFCQIQLNYMDTEEQAGLRGYELATKLDIPVVIMEPVKGGALASLPEEVYAVLNEVTPDLTPSAWAMRFVATFPNVKVVLSGMTEMSHVLDNLNTFSGFEPLNEKEQNAVTRAAELLRSRVRNGCTGCRYCMPCPSGVDIPKLFSIWNTYGIYGNKNGAKSRYSAIPEDALPTVCVGCGACESVCPQSISIINDLQAAKAELECL